MEQKFALINGTANLSSKWILSATELETFASCRRKWGYHYLDGLKPHPSKAALFGSEVHKLLENYLINNQIDYGTHAARVASPGLDYLPKNLKATQVEKPFFFTNNGHIFHGFIDFYDHVGSQTWLIGDHKTTSDFKNALSPESLKKNIQAGVYAQWAFQELGADTVKLKWVYYRTKGAPLARVVETEIKKHEATSNFETHLRIAADIKETLEKRTKTNELPKNLDACFKYGRCPFYAQCKRSPETATITAKTHTTINCEVKESNLSSLSDPKPNRPHLYVDCWPTKNEIDYEQIIGLSELLRPVLEKIRSEKNLSHYRLAGYGQHIALIANYLSEHLRDKAYDNRTAIISSVKTPEGSDTFHTLEAFAGQIVKGS